MQKSKKILYVDDYDDNRHLMRRLLEAEGYSFEEASDGREALHCVKRGKPDLALIDLNLPDMSGYMLSAKIRDLPGLRRLPIIAVTAGDKDQDESLAARAEWDGYIQKPFNVEVLLQEIAKRL